MISRSPRSFVKRFPVDRDSSTCALQVAQLTDDSSVICSPGNVTVGLMASLSVLTRLAAGLPLAVVHESSQSRVILEFNGLFPMTAFFDLL